MFIASGYLACEDGFGLAWRGLGLFAAVVVGERHRGTPLTNNISTAQKRWFHKMRNRYPCIELFKRRLQKFISPRSDTRFSRYGPPKF